jgi:chromate transporter
MFTGQRVAGLPGAGAALLGSLLPPTVLILGVVAVLHRLRREAWVSRFVEGLGPAVAMLLLYVAAKLVFGAVGGAISWPFVALGVASLAAFIRGAPPPLVLLSAGILGIYFFR